MAKKIVKENVEPKVENREQLLRMIDSFAVLHRANELFDKRVSEFRARLAPLVRKFFPVENGESQAKSPSENRIAETDFARVSVTSPFKLKEGEKVPEAFKGAEVTVITNTEEAIKVLRKYTPELLQQVASYDVRAYWLSLDKATMHTKFEIGTPTLKCKVKGKLGAKEIAAVEKEIETIEQE